MDKPIATQLYALRRKVASHSLYDFAQIYLKHHLTYSPSKAHLEIYDLLFMMMRERNKKLAIAAPRNFGKSTMITLIYILYAICFSKESFVVIISETAEQAQQILENVKKELTENSMLRSDFPEIFEAGGKPKPPRWTRNDIVTRNRIQIIALGSGQQIRGRKHGKNRPSAIFLDDIESVETTTTLEVREQTKNWFTSAVLKAGFEATNFFFLGNLHHCDCLLSEYVDESRHPEWIKRTYKAIVSEPKDAAIWEKFSRIFNYQLDHLTVMGPETALKFYETYKLQMDEGAESLWPERWPYVRLRYMYEEDPLAFVREMQNEPLDPRKRTFNVEEFRYWNKRYPTAEELIKSLGDKVEFYAACDPALGASGQKGDYSAIVILAKDTVTNTFYVVVADIARRSPEQLVKDIAAFHYKYKCESFAYEANQFQSLLIRQIEEEGKRQGVRINLKPIKNQGDKNKRIESMSGWVRNGTVQFNNEHRLLIEQMRDFPQGKHDDGPDALEMALKLAEDGGYGQAKVWIVGGDDGTSEGGLRRRIRIDAGNIPGFYNGIY